MFSFIFLLSKSVKKFLPQRPRPFHYLRNQPYPFCRENGMFMLWCQRCCILTERDWFLIKGAFHSTKTFENLGTAANGTEISRKSFQKFRKLLNFPSANHLTENSRNSGKKVEWKENFWEKIFDILGIPREAVLFFGNFGMYFVSGNTN